MLVSTPQHLYIASSKVIVTEDVRPHEKMYRLPPRYPPRQLDHAMPRGARGLRTKKTPWSRWKSPTHIRPGTAILWSSNNAASCRPLMRHGRYDPSPWPPFNSSRKFDRFLVAGNIPGPPPCTHQGQKNKPWL